MMPHVNILVGSTWITESKDRDVLPPVMLYAPRDRTFVEIREKILWFIENLDSNRRFTGNKLAVFGSDKDDLYAVSYDACLRFTRIFTEKTMQGNDVYVKLEYIDKNTKMRINSCEVSRWRFHVTHVATNSPKHRKGIRRRKKY